jgi:hypothetical protein
LAALSAAALGALEEVQQSLVEAGCTLHRVVGSGENCSLGAEVLLQHVADRFEGVVAAWRKNSRYARGSVGTPSAKFDRNASTAG